ncbi:MAG: hypothetical protein GOVbin4206_43 [Prokaryotic dsDNA virus sp.]|nr:MAG: hypothetical protein GOVbin4206_43 [Prokaryotic dsDNA virus sp.]|tara:strand:- start:587 stop:733 length:147 start_codon:yes stop_codon:yes gene_type:complete
MKERVIQFMSNYTLEELAIMLDENLTMLDNIADQFGAEFLAPFVGEEE